MSNSEHDDQTADSSSLNADLEFVDSLRQNGHSESVQSLVSSSKQKLQRTLGLPQGFSLMVGLILGSGIFISPGLVANDTSSTGMMLIVWVCAGILALMGSLCYCELGCLIKMTGSNYANILNIYGNVCAFLCAWTTCFVIDPSSTSAIALTIGVYFTKPFYSSPEEANTAAKLVALGVIIISCFINCISVKFSNRVQSVFAVAQISSVVFVIVLGVWKLSEHNVENFHNVFNGTDLDAGSTLHIGIALFGALWSFDGWAAINNIIEELHNVERNLLLTVVTSFPFVIFCYMMVNISFLSVLSHKDMSTSKAVGVDFVKAVLGEKMSYLMMVLVGLSSYGTLNGTVFSCPRTTLSASREGHMPTMFSFIHRRSGALIPAIILLTLLSSLMLLPSASSLNSLILIFSQAQWVMYGASLFGVVILRIRQPNAHRPFKVFILIPILMSLISLFLVIIPFFRNPLESTLVALFILAGLPVYFVFIHHSLSLPRCCVHSMDSLNASVQKYFNMVPCSK